MRHASGPLGLLNIRKFGIVISCIFIVSCGRPTNEGNLTQPDYKEQSLPEVVEDEVLGLAAIADFYPEPGDCNDYFTFEYYCDGYTQQNIPILPSVNFTSANESSTTPNSGYVGLQVIGQFKSSRPSVVYLHGWNNEGSTKVFGFPDQWAQQANKAGFNVLFFHWTKLSYDDGSGCPGLGWFGVGNIPCNASHSMYKKGGASDKFIAAYKARFQGYSKTVRIVAQSLGAQLAIYSTYRMYKRSDMGGVKLPNRVDLIDPFITPGFGGSRTKAYDGQMPKDSDLPNEVKNNIVKSFVKGSSCHSNWNPLPPNHYSQYCQNEGMAYRLVKDHNVGMIDFSSSVGGASANGFKRVMVYQAFSGSAFKGNLTARHVTPNASYFYSFTPGEPNNGYDASSSDSKILSDARKQAVNRINMAKIQKGGYNTVTFMDDNFQKN